MHPLLLVLGWRKTRAELGKEWFVCNCVVFVEIIHNYFTALLLVIRAVILSHSRALSLIYTMGIMILVDFEQSTIPPTGAAVERLFLFGA